MKSHERLETETRFTGSSGGLTSLEARVPAWTVLAHPDPIRVGEVALLGDLAAGRASLLSRLEPLFAVPGGADPRPLGGAHLSRQPLRVEPAGTHGARIDRAGSPTPVQIDGEPLGDQRVVAAERLEKGVVVELGRRVVLLLHRRVPVPETVPDFGLVGASDAMMRLRREIEIAAGAGVPVLLRGGSGSGKELVARAVHGAGERRGRPWIAVNMAAVPAALAASELFGAARGAFTGAERKKQGFFERAHGGVLFLDEIGETPQDVQPLLLRALETGEIQPVGAVGSKVVDVRVIAATDADLEAEIAEGTFREPLLHRLAGFEIRLPPLVERRDDIGRLLYHFLLDELGGVGRPEALKDEDGRPWPPAALVARLVRHSWPGNVRQLKNVARRLAIAYRTGRPEVAEPMLRTLFEEEGAGAEGRGLDAGPKAEAASIENRSPTGRWRPAYRRMSEIDDAEMLATLRAHAFEIKPAAEALGVSRTALYERMEKSPGVRKAAELGQQEVKEVVAANGGDLAAAAAELEVSAQGLKRRMKSLGLRRLPTQPS